MKTRDLIRSKARELFNSRGLAGVTLRDVAAAMNKSYGNITYHYPNKEILVGELCEEMIAAHQEISLAFHTSGDLLKDLMLAPAATFDISMQYLFLFRDYVQLIREYPEFRRDNDQRNQLRMQTLLPLFQGLQKSGLLDTCWEEKDLYSLMTQSGIVRTFFFIELDTARLSDPDLKTQYLKTVNAVLLPWLSESGRIRYREIEKML